MLGRSALLAATNSVDYGNWLGNYSDVSLLLRGNSETMPNYINPPVDESPSPKLITAVGNATVSIFDTPWSAGSSMAFDGSGDSFTAPSGADFDFSTGPFTIELWAYHNSVSTAIQTYFSLSSGGLSVSGFTIWKNSSNALVFAFYNNSSNATFSITSANSVIAADEWYHIAVTRDASNVFRLFLNGVRQGTNVTSTLSMFSSRTPRIGAWTDFTGRGMNGYIDDFRVTKGIARYVADFAPPVAQLPATVAGDADYNSVSLLIRNGTESGTLQVPLDESQTEKIFKVFGNASVTTAVAKWNEGSGGSSLAFDGSGDYLSTPKNTDFEFGSGDFTIECWARLNVTNVDQAFAFYGAGTSGSVTGWSIEHLTTGFRFYFYTGSTIVTRTHPVVASANIWYHVAAVRNGSSLILYVDGVPSATTTTAASINAPTGALLTVGSLWTTSRFLNGYIDDLRITKGVARYTSNFTPPPAELPNF